MRAAVNEMHFDASMQKLLEREYFRNFFIQLLKNPFIEKCKKNKEYQEKLNRAIRNFFCAIQEVFNNVEEHGVLREGQGNEPYCTIRIEYTDDTIYFFCRDFGPGMNKTQWKKIIKEKSGAALCDPRWGAVDEGSELIEVGTGTYIKLVKKLPCAGFPETVEVH